MCKYQFRRGVCCRESNFNDSEYCILHTNIPREPENEKWNLIDDLKQKEFLKKVQIGDYEFEGAIFGDLKYSGHFNSDVNFNYVKFLGDIDFRGVQFKGDVQFLDTEFLLSAVFKDVIFSGDVYFLRAKFSIVDFGNVKFKKNVYFSGAYFGLVTIFDKSTFFLDAIFKNSKFCEGSTSFKCVNFIEKGIVSFSNSKIFSNIDFSHTDFSKAAYFRKTTFFQAVNFSNASFSFLSFFQYASFLREVNFNQVKFKGEVDFSRATFSTKTDFIWATFSNDVDFSYTSFSKESEFINEVSFKNAKFLGDANFTGATFLGDTHFSDASFQGIFSLEKSQFSKSFFLTILMEENCKLRILNAIFEIDLTIDISKLRTSNSINMIATKIERNLIFKPIIIEGFINIDNLNISGEIEGINDLNFKNPSSEENFNRNVKKYHENLGRFDDADKFFLRERIARRKIKKDNYQKGYLFYYRVKNFVKYWIEWPLEHIFYYGTKPWHTLGLWFIFIATFALFYGILGMMRYPVFKITNKTSLEDYLYFSLTNAMAPGYGVITPEPYGLAKFIPCVQTIISIFFLAIFIAIISRKSMRS